MSLIVNGTAIENVRVNNTAIDKLVYNGVTVFESADELILNVSTVDGGLSGDGVFLIVETGEKGCTVSFNNEVRNIPANSTQEVDFIASAEGTLGNLTIRGDFLSAYPNNESEGQDTYIKGYHINAIIKWYRKLNYVPNYFFELMPIKFDINLPNNIVKIDETAFNLSNTSDLDKYEFTFENLEYCKSFGATSIFFANASNNGDVWSINGFVLAPYGVNAQSRTGTFVIPNGTKHIASELFYYGTNGNSCFNLSKVVFPLDGLLTKIPNKFCTDAINLTEIEIPASIVEIGEMAFAQSAQTMTLKNLTFNEEVNQNVKFPASGQGSGAFYTKSSIQTNVYTENLSVLNYDWAGDNRTVSFYGLDKVTNIPQLSTPTISLNGNILTINSFDINTFKFSIYAFNNIIETSDTIIDLTPYIQSDSFDNTIKVRSLTNVNTYASSLPVSITYTQNATSEV